MPIISVMRQQEILQIVEITDKPLIIGRSKQANLRLEDSSVSRKHLLLAQRSGVVVIKDLGAKNHVLVNGKAIPGAARLNDNDVITVGVYTIRYQKTEPESWQNPGDTQIIQLDSGSDKKILSPVTSTQSVAAVNPPPAAVAKPDTEKIIKTEKTPVVLTEKVKSAISVTPVVTDNKPAATASASSGRLLAQSSTYSPSDADSITEDIEVIENDDNLIDQNAIVSDSSAISPVIGEFEADEDENIEIQAGDEPLTLLETPAELQAWVEKRMAIARALDKLDEQRQVILRRPDYPKEPEAEVRRQMRELLTPLTAEQAKERIEKLDSRLQKLEEIERRREAGEQINVEPLPKEFDPLWKLAKQQWQLFIDRDEMTHDIITAGYKAAEGEPLRALLEQRSIDGLTIFGQTMYALALSANIAKLTAERREIRPKLTNKDKDAKNKGGMFGFFKSKDSDDDATSQLLERDNFCAQEIIRLNRELKAFEKPLLQAFWQLYAELAVILVAAELRSAEEIYVRAYLRYGLLGTKPHFIAQDILKYILDDCAKPVRKFDHTQEGTHVLYADEYISFVANGNMTPSIDEDLELNQAQTPLWKAEKAWRRRIYSHLRKTALTECLEQLEEKIITTRQLNQTANEDREKLIKSAPDYRKRNAELSALVQSTRVEAARLERICERIRSNYLPNLDNVLQDAEERIAQTGVNITPEFLARQEAKGIWRVSRLTANLHEVFPPFSLRDRFRLDNGSVNDRETVLGLVNEIEHADPAIFKDTLVTAKQKTRRVYLRFCPYILLTPGCGFLGYAWNPRAGTEVGRLVYPLYCPRIGMRERIMHPLMADFRFDTSKAMAGVDLLTSDTLVAAYATVRWDYRKRSKEMREKAAIYSEETDRRNWRRHYALYLQSADEGGKKLFFKCIEVYEALLRYIDLPDGVERLRR